MKPTLVYSTPRAEKRTYLMIPTISKHIDEIAQIYGKSPDRILNTILGNALDLAKAHVDFGEIQKYLESSALDK